MSAAALAPRGLIDRTPTVLGIRVLAADPELICDIVVDAARIRVSEQDARALSLPDTALAPAWAGISPPRSGWMSVGEISSEALSTHARSAFAEVAAALPETPGDELVQRIRSEVWGRVSDDLAGLPVGVACAAVALGFIGDAEQASVHAVGTWHRLSLRRGHVLVRNTVRGLN